MNTAVTTCVFVPTHRWAFTQSGLLTVDAVLFVDPFDVAARREAAAVDGELAFDGAERKAALPDHGHEDRRRFLHFQTVENAVVAQHRADVAAWCASRRSDMNRRADTSA